MPESAAWRRGAIGERNLLPCNYKVFRTSRWTAAPMRFSPVISLKTTDVVGPNGGVGPITNWDGNGSSDPDTDLINYDILLTGTIPEPATWSLTILAAGCFALLRRKVRR